MAVGYSTREVAKLVNLPEHRIRAYARAGLVGNRTRNLRFDFRDLLVLRMAGRLLSEGLAPVRVQRALAALRRRSTEQKPLSGNNLSSQAGRVIASDGSILWDPESGQCLLRFGAKRIPEAMPTPLPQRGEVPPAKSPSDVVDQLNDRSSIDGADYWFDMALELEERDPQRSYELYLRALAADPEHVEATINIGRLCSANNDLRRAAAYFRQAVRIDPAHPVAHFNLAVTMHDMGQLETAVDAYRTALLHDPHFADAHYNLATLLEQQGEPEEALRHFNAYRSVSREPQ